MTLKPNYLRAIIKTLPWLFAFIAITSWVVPYFQGKEVRASDILPWAPIVGVVFCVSVVVFFTPREIKWDNESIKIRALFPGSGHFKWQQLEAWHPPYGRLTFLIKFEGNQAYQIVPAGFRSADWKVFRSFLQSHFPEKKTSMWFGVMRVRFGKK